jgi:RNA polymerase sigma-70 factor (ECF subfamily)
MDGDTELARRAAGGDVRAFGRLVRLHEARVRRFLARLVRGDGADDIAQEVFLKAWRMRGRWREEGRYGAWLMGIAWTSFLDFKRVQARHARSDEPGPAEEGPSPDLDGAIDLARAMAALDDRTRAAAQLCFAEGYSHGEAAAILQLPLGTLKSMAARARAQLAAALETGHD